jgi:hypothetical protein
LGWQADHFRAEAAMGRFLISLFAMLAGAVPASVLAVTFGSVNPNFQNAPLTVVRGHAICLNSSGREVESPFGCAETGSRFAFASKDGKLYKFLPTDTMVTVFTDTRVRQRELQLTARLHNGDQLEIIKVQSIKEGKIYDIYYFCDVCTITSYTPGLCPCCRNEMEFREKPQ